MKKLQLLVAILATVVLAVPSIASAADYGGIGGRPANPQADNPRTQSIFIYELKPGEQASDGVTVFNSTSKSQQISVYPVDSVLSSDGAFACAQQVEAKKDVGSWITLQQSTVTLEPNSSQVIPFMIAVPDTAGVGEHDGCIAIQGLSASETSPQGGVTLSFRSAIRVAVTIPGQIVKKLSLTSVDISKSTGSAYSVKSTAKNDGNVSLDTTLHVRLVPLIGVSSPSASGVYPVLPRTLASWNIELKRPFWGGLYRAEVTATYNGNVNTELGKQRSSDAVTSMRNSSYFVALPELPAAAIELTVMLVILGVIIWFIAKHASAHKVKRSWQTYTLDPGDTLESLAKDFHVSWKQIAKVNHLKPPYNLHGKQKLRLPPTEE